MTIQFNTDKNVSGTENRTPYFTSLVLEELVRYRDQITRIEIHLSNQNSNRNGLKDMRCLLEARLEDMKAIAVAYDANTEVQAVNGAIDKLKNSLSTVTGKVRNY